MASSLKHMSFKAIPASDLEKADEVQLKTMAHSLLESKLEKLMSTAGNPEQMSKTKKLAVEWLRKWDLDQDGVLSSTEMKAAAMEHARLERDYKARGIWMLVLALLIFCCGGVILGVSIWANAISKDSEVETGEDLGGYTMRKKDGSAVVKTATALYGFPLPRIGYLPFDELSTISSISFLYQRTLRQMSVEGFKWFGTHNITFYSPRGEQLTITKANDTEVTMTYSDAVVSGATAAQPPSVIYSGTEPSLVYQQLLFTMLDGLHAQGVPITPTTRMGPTVEISMYAIQTLCPVECVEPARVQLMDRSRRTLEEPCATLVMMALEGFGVIEAGVGPQDYYSTRASEEERQELGEHSMLGTEMFVPDVMAMFERYDKWLDREVKVRYGS
eukprot:jgi/Mesvir1/2090/Mv16622-RA.1